MRQLLILSLSLLLLHSSCLAQPLSGDKKPGRQDSLRGTYGPERSWWDVLHYDITVQPNYKEKTIKGSSKISYKTLPGQKSDYMQIDLQQPMELDSIFYDNKLYINYPAKPYYREGNVFHIPLPRAAAGSEHSIRIAYHGKPRQARTPPWDGGWVWAKDKEGRPWMSVACQGLGASVWFPCKDHQSDEPDNGATLNVIVPKGQVAVGNGRLTRETLENDMEAFHWTVTSPINIYTIVPSIGSYASWKDTLMGEKGKLDLTYWCLDYNLVEAKNQFQQVKPTIRAFEYWFGPYPFYEDGYQLVETPYLGMEHQSNVAYGNKFKNGYLGRDLSGTGWGMKWDYIIVHESGHEWFANNVTTKDIADMWVHEGFTDYSETLFTEYYYGKEAADEYLQGLRGNIQNDVPIIGPYNVNREGSGDMYYKGANMLHTIRQIINNDSLFRSILRGLNRDFYHQTVTTQQVEQYMISHSGKDLQPIFDQYLRRANPPVLQWKKDGDNISFSWINCAPNFNMPLRLKSGFWIFPTTKTTTVKLSSIGGNLSIDPNFYVLTKPL